MIANVGLFGEDRPTIFSLDASAGKDTLPRTGSGEVKHLRTKQLWSQGAMQSYGVELLKELRGEIASDVLAHQVGGSGLKQGPQRIDVWSIRDLGPCWGNPCGRGVLGEARCGLLGLQAPLCLVA